MSRYPLLTYSTAISLGLLSLGSAAQTAPPRAPVQRADFIVSGPAHRPLAVRRVARPAAPGRVVVLVHGGGPGGLASFDLDVPGGSLAADLAQRGFIVYVLNVRGWGGSPDPVVPSVTSQPVNGSCRQASQDIHRVVQTIRRREGVAQVVLFGWATGGHWGGYYATHHRRRVSHFISLNSLYGVRAPWGLRAAFADPHDSTRYNKALGPWRSATATSLTSAWEQSIPVADKNQWRDSAVQRAYGQTALRADSGALQRQPPTMRVPGGYREEAFYQSLGRPYWLARRLRLPVLALRGELDFWSRPADLTALAAELPAGFPHKTVTLPQATHFVFLDRPERGRAQMLTEIEAFLR
ncbi:alpha/beta hydrolase [Hymenobacter chitinivorans]|uniref:Alpha-beta hydrolase superfamily lysophospholipase n=1 Tax=Hymenobacter chitinivorans DSM 11115 TaxID=1121954 RepID=A0A2M9BNQ4_9BACT|nr:alpha/beta fold hydrolase [Hymenobacter chitinivorans]PJJ59568.1 alpha-beta hydrolase superfamily lysophospholipase [Hymenobacter chitinivorans DSM 11115]